MNVIVAVWVEIVINGWEAMMENEFILVASADIWATDVALEAIDEVVWMLKCLWRVSW